MENKTRKLLKFWQQINLLSPITMIKTRFYNPTDKDADYLSEQVFLSLPLKKPDGSNKAAFKQLIEKAKTNEIEVVIGLVQHMPLYNFVNRGLDEKHQIKIVEHDRSQSFVFYLRLDRNEGVQKSVSAELKFNHVIQLTREMN